MAYKEYRVCVHDNGDREWWYNGERHREDGPAIEYSNGMKNWFVRGMRHREDGPAFESAHGRSWYINNMLHREDGPAVENANGTKEWWIKGEKLTEAQFLARNNSCAGKIVEIDGKKYKLIEA